MKKLILFLISCSAIANLAALEWDSPVILPARKVLKDRLYKAGFDHFEEKTKLSEHLARYEMRLSEMELGMVDYIPCVHDKPLNLHTTRALSKYLERCGAALRRQWQLGIAKAHIEENKILKSRLYR